MEIRLRTQMEQIYEELVRIRDASEMSEELMTLIQVIAKVMEGMKEKRTGA